MYNRYIRNDNGVYHRIPVETPSPEPSPAKDNGDFGIDPEGAPPLHKEEHRSGRQREKRSLLSGLLGKLKLENVDTGDLLLLAILFLLFRDGEDEELLIALALLLIL